MDITTYRHLDAWRPDAGMLYELFNTFCGEWAIPQNRPPIAPEKGKQCAASPLRCGSGASFQMRVRDEDNYIFPQRYKPLYDMCIFIICASLCGCKIHLVRVMPCGSAYTDRHNPPAKENTQHLIIRSVHLNIFCSLPSAGLPKPQIFWQAGRIRPDSRLIDRGHFVYR